MKKKSGLSHLRNVGPTNEKRLNEIGIFTRQDLQHIGAASAYKKIKVNYPDRTIPVCYYLYPLKGALVGKHWDALPKSVKEDLLKQASVE